MQKTAYEMLRSLVGSEMCIRDSMPTTMTRIHEIHNKLNREADSEKASMDLVIQLTRTDIFDIIRSHYPFLYSQIVEKENAIRTRYRREQRISKLFTGDTQTKRGVEYHPFNTLFQLTCKFIRSHEPLTLKPNQGSVNIISQAKKNWQRPRGKSR